MKLTNQQVQDIYPILFDIKNSKKAFPVKVAYSISRNLKALQSIIDDIDPVRLDILNKYGTPEEDRSAYTIPPDKVQIVMQELDNLGEVENDIKVYTIKLDQLDGYDLSVEEMDALDFMIEESEE